MKQKTLRPFGLRDKLGYMFGDFGNDFTFILSTSILMKFYTDVMGVSAGVVGTLMMLARFVDAITDVTMGRICDASKPTAAGKFKPWLLRMCVPVAIASFLMYAPGLATDVVALPICALPISCGAPSAIPASTFRMAPWLPRFLPTQGIGRAYPPSVPWAACWRAWSLALACL